MSHIIVSTKDGIVESKLVAALRSCSSGSMDNIVTALKNGSPLFEGELFVASRLDRFSKLRNLLGVLLAAGVEPNVWEDGHPIDSQTLLNIMQPSDDSMAEFDRLSEFGHEA
jgi:hypothetical protein